LANKKPLLEQGFLIYRDEHLGQNQPFILPKIRIEPYCKQNNHFGFGKMFKFLTNLIPAIIGCRDVRKKATISAKALNYCDFFDFNYFLCYFVAYISRPKLKELNY